MVIRFLNSEGRELGMGSEGPGKAGEQDLGFNQGLGDMGPGVMTAG